MKLYEMPAAIQALLDAAVDPESGEISEISAAKLDALELAFDEKVEGCCMAIRTALGEAELLQKEAEMFAVRARARARAAASLKSYVMNNMAAAGKKSAGGRMLVASIRGSAAALRVISKEQVQTNAKAALVAAVAWEDPSKIMLREEDANGREWSIFAGPDSPWKIQLILQPSRAKELVVPPGCEWQPCKALHIVPGK